MRIAALATWSLAVLMTALLAIGFLTGFATSPAAAEDGAFCINGFNYDGGLGDCSFSSYAQCEATASGTANTCLANPYFHAKPDTPPARGRVSRRRS
jgi:Protein of unknown function (DUF3551)